MNEFTITIGGEKIYWCAPDAFMLNAALKHIAYRDDFVKEINKAVGGTIFPKEIIDVGACTGSFSWVFHYLWPEARIHAYEPVRESFQCLQKNMGHFPQVELRQCGLSDHVGEMTMAMPTFEQKNYMNRYGGENIGIMSVYGESDVYRQEVAVYPLDDLHETADIIKIDAEGHDYRILLGARKLIENSRPVLFLELIPSNVALGGFTLDEFLELMVEFQYKPTCTFVGNVAFLPLEMLSKKYRDAKIRIVPRGFDYRFEWDFR